MTRFERWMLWGTTALVSLTGVGLLWTKYFVSSDDPWAVINHPLQPWFLKAHILAAPLMIFALGLIATRHIWQHYRAGVGRGRRTGILAVVVAAPMILSGYLLQVLTQTGWLRAVAILHLAASGVFLIGLAAHQLAVGPRRFRPGSPDRTAGRRPGARPSVADRSPVLPRT